MTDNKEGQATDQTVANEEKNNKVGKADILSNFKVPVKKGKGRMDKCITLNLKTSHLILTKAMIFYLGYPKTIAFSFTDNKVFIVANTTLEGIVSYDVRKVSTIAQLNTNINNKDLCTDLGITFGVFEGIFELNATHYMDINNNKVYELTMIPKK